MDEFAALTGRSTACSTTSAHPEAERVIVLMGSGAETARDRRVAERPRREGRRAEGPPVPAVLGRALPRRAAEDRAAIAVLDRTKEPGAVGEPLYLGRRHRLREAKAATAPAASRCRSAVVGGRYGLSSKEFTPAMVKAVFDELAKAEPRRTTSPSASWTT
jgi:pyruvate-ferredoxin/flavodoxin oxidoreductase